MLAVAQQLASYAFAQKAAQGDAEVSQVRAVLTQRQSEMRALERRCDELEAEARASQRCAQLRGPQCARVIAAARDAPHAPPRDSRQAARLLAPARRV